MPGFEQTWTGPSHFTSTYTKQDGLLPYNSVDKLVKELDYKIYHINTVDENNQAMVTGSYIYNPNTKQFVGYQSLR